MRYNTLEKPEDNSVRQCRICNQYFYSYPDNPLLVCPDYKDAIKEYVYPFRTNWTNFALDERIKIVSIARYLMEASGLIPGIRHCSSNYIPRIVKWAYYPNIARLPYIVILTFVL